MASQLLGGHLHAAGLHGVRRHQPAGHLQEPFVCLLELAVVVLVLLHPLHQAQHLALSWRSSQ